MSWILIAVIVFIVLIVFGVLAIFVTPKKSKNEEFSYEKLEFLFSPAERSFLGVLKLAVNNDLEIFGKVRVADVISPIKGQKKGVWQRSFNKISAKHFDYVLCDKNDLSVLCVIELNDKSHKKAHRRKRDEFLNKACQSASLKLINIEAKRSYQVTEIKNILEEYLQKEETKVNLPNAKLATVKETNQIKVNEPQSDKTCPKCSSKMVLRLAKRGKNEGNEFWACSTFPKCRYVEKK